MVEPIQREGRGRGGVRHRGRLRQRLSLHLNSRPERGRGLWVEPRETVGMVGRGLLRGVLPKSVVAV